MNFSESNIRNVWDKVLDEKLGVESVTNGKVACMKCQSKKLQFLLFHQFLFNLKIFTLQCCINWCSDQTIINVFVWKIPANQDKKLFFHWLNKIFEIDRGIWQNLPKKTTFWVIFWQKFGKTSEIKEKSLNFDPSLSRVAASRAKPA